MNLYLLLASLPFVLADVSGPLTSHFQDWLASRGEGSDYALHVVKEFGKTGSYGGRVDEDDTINHTPIVFIHGNSDSALAAGNSPWCTGWNMQISYFRSHGYTSAEMYALTYGDRKIENAFHRTLGCRDLLGHRKFLEAVLEYTGAMKLNIVAHSMGVTIARVVIRGGVLELPEGDCDLGAPMMDKIDTILAISSANYGMCTCLQWGTNDGACNMRNGFFPGQCSAEANQGACNSQSGSVCSEWKESPGEVLWGLHNGPKEAKRIISFWSNDDEVLGEGNYVWGRQTSFVPHSDSHRQFRGLTHMQTKTETVREQYRAIKKHHMDDK